MDTNDELLRAIAIVSSIKDNLPSDDPNLEVRWVDEYHRAVTRVEGVLNCHLDEFRVEQASIGPIVVAITGAGQREYSDERYCDRHILLQKCDALLKYLNYLLTPPPTEKPRIGFEQ